MLKDDHLHYAGQWSHPDCGVEDADVSCIEGQDEGSQSEDITRFSGLNTAGDESSNDANTTSAVPIEGDKKETTVACEGKESSKKIIGGHPATGHPKEQSTTRSKKVPTLISNTRTSAVRTRGRELLRTIVVICTQTGIQIMSISGHTMVFDDSVEEPSGEPEWERSTESFDFGCNDKFVGRTYWKSATGHMIEMSDLEADAKLRARITTYAS
jgi:hypothetical protein